MKKREVLLNHIMTIFMSIVVLITSPSFHAIAGISSEQEKESGQEEGIDEDILSEEGDGSDQRTKPIDLSHMPDALLLSIAGILYREEGMNDEIRKQPSGGTIDLSGLDLPDLEKLTMELSFESVKSKEERQLQIGDTFQYKIPDQYLTLENTNGELPVTTCQKEDYQKGKITRLHTIGSYIVSDNTVTVTITDDTYLNESDQIFGILEVPFELNESALDKEETSSVMITLSERAISLILPPAKAEKQEQLETIKKEQQADLKVEEKSPKQDSIDNSEEVNPKKQSEITILPTDSGSLLDAEFSIRWRDNNSPTRPDGIDSVGIKIYFQLDGGAETELTESTMGLIGLTQLPAVTKETPGVDTTIYHCEGLFAEYDEKTITYRMESTIVPDGYVEYIKDGVTYYIKTYEFEASIQMKDGGQDEGPDLSKLNIRIGRADGSYETISVSALLTELNLQEADVCERGDNNVWSLKIPNLPKYAIGESGAVIVELVSTITVDDSLKTPQPNGDYYEIEYDNSTVANYGTESSKCHNGGIISLTLKGEVDYEATKIWLDDGDAQTILERPGGTFYLWRYTKKGTNDYQKASQVYYTGGSQKGNVIQKDLDTNTTKYKFEMKDYNDSNVEIPLPKYDPEGYEYVYIVRENLDNTQYEAVYIESFVESGGKITEIVSENRAAADISIYDDGIVGNRKSGTKKADLTKTWKASAEQSNLGDVEVTFKLQSKSEGQTSFTDVVPKKTASINNFLPETLTQTVEHELSAYDSVGIPIEYQWVEESIKLGTTDVPLTSDPIAGHPERQTFTLQYEDGRNVNYESVTENGITVNRLIGTIDYEVDKYWWDAALNQFSKTTPNGITDLTIILYQDSKRYPDSSTSFLMDGTIDPGGFPEDSPWHFTLKDLPKYDSSGREYIYRAEEVAPPGWSATYDYSIKNKVKMMNGQGDGGNEVRIEKKWQDDNDVSSRKSVKVDVYAAQALYDENGDLVHNPGDRITGTTLTEDIGWWDRLGILVPYTASKTLIKNEDAFYVRETHMGGYIVQKDARYPNKPEADVKDIVTTTQKPSDYKYEITYEYSEMSGGIFIVTNRRIGTVDIVVTKDWIDQGADKTDRPDTKLNLKIVDGEVTLVQGVTKDSLKIKDAYGTDIITDITDSDLTTGVKATQIIEKHGATVNDEGKIIYNFFNLPKYDENGAVIHYDVEEIMTGNQNDYVQTEKETEYEIQDGVSHTHDIQKITYTNQRIGTKNIKFYKAWKDAYMYVKGKRPDIFLNLYAQDSVHSVIYAVDEYKPRKWTPDSVDAIYSWECAFDNLNKYDINGQEINYYVKEITNVNLEDFDYLQPEYYKDFSAGIIAEDGNGDALNLAPEDGTIVNALQKYVNFNGKKVWKNIPKGLLAADLPDIKVELMRKIEGEPDSNWTSIETITTIANPDRFEDIGTDGYSYSFTLDNNGNKYERYNINGELYEYMAKETILGDDGLEMGLANVIYANTDETTIATSDFTLENVFDISREDRNAKGKVIIEKLWDNFPAGGIYPVVTFSLYRTYGAKEKELISTKTLNANKGETQVIFDKLLLYAPNGTQYRYSVEETGMNGYEIRVLEGTKTIPDFSLEPVNRDSGILNPSAPISDSQTVTFLNTYTPGIITSLEGVKTWNDFNNAFGTRPADITLTLSRKANAQTGQSNAILPEDVVISLPVLLTWDKTAAGTWSYKVTGLDKYATNGMPWIYTVTETPVSDYTTIPSNGVVEQSEYNIATNIITMNTLTNSLYKSASVNKIWDDGNDPYGLRPPQIYVKLQVSEDEGVTYQDAVSYFATWLSGDTEKDNAIHQLITSITTKNNSKIANNILTTTYTGLPAGVNKSNTYTKLRYRFIETMMGLAAITYDDGTDTYIKTGAYQPSNENPVITAGTNGTDLTKITNTLDDELTLDVEKIWEDKNNAYNTRPDKITFILQRRYVNIPNDPFVDAVDTITGEIIKKDLLSSTNPSTVSFPHLQKYDENNNEYEYTVRELIDGTTPEILNNYTVTSTNSVTKDQYDQAVSYQTTIKNTLSPVVTVKASKAWLQESTISGQSVELELLKKVGDTYESFTPKSVITLDGTTDGTETDGKMESAPWEATWKGLPEKNNDGTKAVYKVVETKVNNVAVVSNRASGYLVSYEAGVGEYQFIVTNTESISFGAEKIWAKNTYLQTEDVPAKVTVKLQRKAQDETVFTDVAGQEKEMTGPSWSITFTDLPKYKQDSTNKVLYEYRVLETVAGESNTIDAVTNSTNSGVITGDSKSYEVSYINQSDKTIVTNTLKTVNISGIKQWEDNDNAYMTRPADITLNLYAQPEGGTKVLVPAGKTPAPVWEKIESEWKYTFYDLPKYNKEGKAYTYSIEEVPIGNNKYVTSYDTKLLNITNKLTSLSISKVEQNGSAVNDVELTIYHVDALNQKGAVAAIWDRSSGGVVVSKVDGNTMTGTDAGKIIGLSFGRYVITETRRPSGYVAANDIYFSLNEKNEVKITDQTGVEIIGASELSYDPVTGYTIIVINNQNPVPIAVKKYWDSTVTPIENVYFEIYRYTSADKSTSKKQTISGQDVFKTNLTGDLLLDNGNEIFLSEGIYYLKEVSTADSPSNVYIDPANKTEFTITGADLVTYENTPTWKKQVGSIYNTVFQSKISLYKYDPKNAIASQGLSGVGFKLVRLSQGLEVPYGGVPANSGKYVTDTNGTLEIDLQEKGTYKLYEETPLQGYQSVAGASGYICDIYIDDEDYNKTVTVNKANISKGKVNVNTGTSLLTDIGLINERFTGTVTLQKADGEDNSKLNGVAFKIYKKQGDVSIGGEYETGNYYKDYTSITPTAFEKGSLKIGGLEWGDYYVVETKPSDGYIKTNTQYFFTIDAANAKDGINLAVGSNAIKNYKNSLTITKLDADTKEPLDGVMFRIINESNTAMAFMIENNVAVVVKVGTKNSVTDIPLGTLTLRGLKAGTYTIQEKQPLDGYRKNKDYKFSIDDVGNIKAVDQDPMYQVNNQEKSIIATNRITSVTIKKTDLTGNVLEGATFSLYQKNGKTSVFTGTTSSNGTLNLNKVMTSCDTLKGNKGVPDVWYRLEETKAPSGYKITKERYIYLGEGHILYQSFQKPASNTQWEKAGNNSLNGSQIQITNEETLISFNKTGRIAEICSDISLGAADPNAVSKLEGVTFTIYAQENPELPLQSSVSDENGVVKFAKLPYGNYLIRETNAAKGYLKSDITYHAVIDNKGNFSVLTTDDSKAVENNQVINDVPRTNITMLKVSEKDRSKVLPGAVYGLSKKNESTGEQQLIAKTTTDVNGILTFEGILMNVEYILQEMEAPEGSYVSQNTIKIMYRVDKNGNIVLAKFEDGNGTAYIDPETGEIVWLEPPVVVEIRKKDDDNKLLAGAKLTLTDGAGTVIDTWTSSENEGHTIEGILITGKPYTLTETTAPAGYETAQPITFTVEEKKVGPGEDIVMEVVMIDKKITTDHTVTNNKGDDANALEQWKKKGFVQTGDDSNSILYIVLMILSVCIMLFAGYQFKKKKL